MRRVSDMIGKNNDPRKQVVHLRGELHKLKMERICLREENAELREALELENTRLKAEVERLQEGINDLRMYNGDQEEMSNIFARLKEAPQ